MANQSLCRFCGKSIEQPSHELNIGGFTCWTTGRTWLSPEAYQRKLASKVPVQTARVEAKPVIDSRAATPNAATTSKDAEEFPLSDTSNAERFARQNGENVRYCWAQGRWYYWTGKQWAVDDGGYVERLAKETARSWLADAASKLDDAQRKRLVRHAEYSLSGKGRREMIRLAQSEAGIPVNVGQFDHDPWLLNCENGTVDLTTGELRPHRREDLITKKTPVEYDRNADCPIFKAFLEHVFPSPNMRRYVQKVFGYSLTALTREQELYFGYGGGANGKTTLLNAYLGTIGDYGKQAAPDLLVLQKGDNRHPTELADLLGARFVASVEVEDGRRFAEVLVKQLTGGDPVKARFMRQDFFQFLPTHKIFFAANHRPAIKGTDYAIWRRIRLIPFTVTIPAEEQDKTLPDKLRAEASGILNWAIEGCMAWQRDGLKPPEDVVIATEKYRADQDVLAVFLSECCVLNPSSGATAKALYATYKHWCEQAGERAESQQSFGRRLSERGLTPEKGTGGKRIWRGIGVLSDTAGIVADMPIVADSGGDFGYEHTIQAPRERYTENGLLSATAATIDDNGELPF